jgi:hypothetical protein
VVPCPLYAQYRLDRDKAAYARSMTGFLRAISEPIVAAYLLPVGGSRRCEAARINAFYADLEARAADSPGEFVARNVHVLATMRRR